jgi:hypothetical protein
MARTFSTTLPPRDTEILRVVVHYHDGNKTPDTISVKDAAERGFLQYTSDDRGYVKTITSLEDESEMPEGVKMIRPLGYGSGGKPWVVVPE